MIPGPGFDINNSAKNKNWQGRANKMPKQVFSYQYYFLTVNRFLTPSNNVWWRIVTFPRHGKGKLGSTATTRRVKQPENYKSAKINNNRDKKWLN